MIFRDYFYPDLAFLDVTTPAYADLINNTSFPGTVGETINVPGISGVT